MNYEHPILQMLGLSEGRVVIIMERLDDDLKDRLEASIHSGGPVELAREIVGLAIIQEKRLR